MSTLTKTVTFTILADNIESATNKGKVEKDAFMYRLQQLANDKFNWTSSALHVSELGVGQKPALKCYRCEFFIYKSLKK